MSTTLTSLTTGEGLTLGLVLDYRADTEVPTVVHRIIGRTYPDFTVQPAQTRAGTFNLWCADEADALALVDLLRAPGRFTLADTDTSIANTTFVVTGRVAIELDPVAQRRVVVRADYTEARG